MLSQRKKDSESTSRQLKKSAWVVDDDLSNRIIIAAYLEKMGYQVFEAANGQEALNLFENSQSKPDIILMDVEMPVMDGYQATKEIKRITQGEYVPVIFISGLSGELTLQHCIENGGDDYISKPVNLEIFKSKVFAHQRIRDLQSKVANMYTEMLTNQNLAKSIYEKMLQVNNQQFDGIHKVFNPSDVFSGDLILTAYTPARDVIVVLTDFTGHGMSASIGALPVSMLFRQYCAQGLHIREIIRKLNKALYVLLPTEIFMAAQFVYINHNLDKALVYNFAMPEVLVIDEKSHDVTQRLESRGMALGIMEFCNPEEVECEIDININDRILLFTDGITEFESSAGEEFSENKLVDIIKNSTEEFHSDAIYQKLMDSNLEEKQHDDISLVEIKCSTDILPVWSSDVFLARTCNEEFRSKVPVTRKIFEFKMTLHGVQLTEVDPVPLLLTVVRSYEPCNVHRQAIFAIIQDLYTHALNYSISEKVNLDFAKIEKGRDLDCLDEEYILLDLKIMEVTNKKQFHLTVKDSGIGFDFSSIDKAIQNNTVQNIDRSLNRTVSICQELTFSESGTRVSAVYEWGDI